MLRKNRLIRPESAYALGDINVLRIDNLEVFRYYVMVYVQGQRYGNIILIRTALQVGSGARAGEICPGRGRMSRMDGIMDMDFSLRYPLNHKILRADLKRTGALSLSKGGGADYRRHL